MFIRADASRGEGGRLGEADERSVRAALALAIAMISAGVPMVGSAVGTVSEMASEPRSHAGPLSVDLRCEDAQSHAQSVTPVLIGDCLVALLNYEQDVPTSVLELVMVPMDRVDGLLATGLSGSGADVEFGTEIDVPEGQPVRLRLEIKWCRGDAIQLYIENCIPRSDPWEVDLDVELVSRDRRLGEGLAPVSGTPTVTIPGISDGSISALRIGEPTGLFTGGGDEARLEIEPSEHVHLWARFDLDEDDLYVDLPEVAKELQLDARSVKVHARDLPTSLRIGASSSTISISHDGASVDGYATGRFGEVSFQGLPQKLKVTHSWYSQREDCSGEFERRDYIRVEADDAPWGANLWWNDQGNGGGDTDEHLDASLTMLHVESFDLTVDQQDTVYEADVDFVNDEGRLHLGIEGEQFSARKCTEVPLSIFLDAYDARRAKIAFDMDARPVIEMGANLNGGGSFEADVDLDFLEAFGHEPTFTAGIDREAWQCDLPAPYRIVVPQTIDRCVREGSCRDWWYGVHMGRFCATEA